MPSSISYPCLWCRVCICISCIVLYLFFYIPPVHANTPNDTHTPYNTHPTCIRQHSHHSIGTIGILIEVIVCVSMCTSYWCLGHEESIQLAISAIRVTLCVWKGFFFCVCVCDRLLYYDAWKQSKSAPYTLPFPLLQHPPQLPPSQAPPNTYMQWVAHRLLAHLTLIHVPW